MASRPPHTPGAPTAADAVPRPAAPPRPAVRAFSLAVLAVATIAAFAGVVRNGWIDLDDPAYITANPHVTGGLTREALAWFVRHPHAENWHPLTSYSHLLDVQLFGLDAGAHHAMGLALHVANALLLVWVLFRLTGAWWRALLVGALWALHPLRVESVAWASERKDVLSMLFFLLTLAAWRRWTERPAPARYAAVVAALALGLLSKSMLVTAPLVLLLLDAWPLARSRPAGVPPRRAWAARVREKWPLFALAAVFALVTYAVQRAGGAVVATGTVPVAQRLANAAVSCIRYVAMTAWPAHLAPFHPEAPVPVPEAVACALALAAVTAAAFALRRRYPPLAVGWAWYGLTLLPVIGLVQVGGQAYADRYTYLPTLGLLVSIAWVPVPPRWAPAALIAGLLAAAALVVPTRRQAALWHDTTTLFTHTLRVAPGNAMAHDCLGTAYMRAGRNEEAIAQFEQAVRLRPDFANPYLNLAELLHRQGRDEEAIRHYERVRPTRPDDPDLLEGEADALAGAGRLDESLRLYAHVLALQPDRAAALRSMGIALARRGRLSEALPLLRRAVALAPRDAAAHDALGRAIYVSRGSAADAVAELREASALAPEWAPPLVMLAMILAGDPDPAVRDPAAAVRLGVRAVALTQGADPAAHAALAAARAAAARPAATPHR